ncbi:MULTISPECIES: nicotinate-nucleotide adenylyltransferase [unclassified Thioalkalivibrio]|uniref:nicotinate-nucleotide adenylyltransferase n=1 Tax=unclassified Thioalkalivibrio TaxID=2621013 RepID=UPI000363B316|nr:MULTISPECIES: nicotinate-nucleotide adenylyltransferase [unclassified Thioalkalivibrio]
MIGILGGTFDPIHFGHLRPALEIQQHLGLERVHFIPCHVPPHRASPGTGSDDRLAMVESAIADVPGFVADRRELDREGPSYTVDTLLSFREELGPEAPLVLIMGMDAFAGLPSWNRWKQIFDLAHIVVSHRPGSPASQDLGGWLGNAATRDPAVLRNAPGGRVYFQPVTQLDISATAIRDELQAGRSPRFLLPGAVNRYIHDRGLYRAVSNRNHGI